MAETWYPLLTGFGDPNIGFNVIPDWDDGKIYTFTVISNVSHLFASNATTGVAISDTLLSAICVISSNTFIVSPNVLLGTDGANIYAMTSNSGGAGQQANLRLSKISTASLLETATAIPYAITNKIGQGYQIFNAGDWRMVAFALNGVDYIALLLNGSDPANIEIFNASTLASVVTFNYTTQTATSNWMVVGEQPTATTQKLYLVQEDPNVVDQQIGVVAVTFDVAPSISDSLIVNILATDIDAAWTGSDITKVDTDPFALMFCSTDNSIIFAVLNDITPSGLYLPLTKVVKVNTTTGDVEWTVTVSTAVFSLPNPAFAQASLLNDLSCCTLVFNDPNTNTYYVIDVPTGTSSSTTSIYFDGTVSDDGVRYPAVWDSVRQRLIYYYEGSDNVTAGWLAGGWAVWGPDGDLGCCGSAPVAKTYNRIWG